MKQVDFWTEEDFQRIKVSRLETGMVEVAIYHINDTGEIVDQRVATLMPHRWDSIVGTVSL